MKSEEKERDEKWDTCGVEKKMSLHNTRLQVAVP